MRFDISPSVTLPKNSEAPKINKSPKTHEVVFFSFSKLLLLHQTVVYPPAVYASPPACEIGVRYISPALIHTDVCAPTASSLPLPQAEICLDQSL